MKTLCKYIGLYLLTTSASLFSADAKDQTPYKVSLDLLFWNAEQSGSDNWAQIFYNPEVNNNLKLLSVPFNINLGLRGSVAYQYDDLESRIKYTWFSTTGKNQTQVNSPSLIHSTFLGNFFVGNSEASGLSGATYRQAAIQWKINMNMADVELATNWFASKYIGCRAFFGVKGGSINQYIQSNWEKPTEGTFIAQENLKNDFSGIGPLVGLDSDWHFTDSLSIFANASAALVVGKWTLYDTYQNTEPKKIVINSPSRYGSSPMFSLLMGAKWYKNGFSIKVGYEGQLWFEQAKLITYNLSLMNNHLTIQGVTLSLDYKF